MFYYFYQTMYRLRKSVDGMQRFPWQWSGMTDDWGCPQVHIFDRRLAMKPLHLCDFLSSWWVSSFILFLFHWKFLFTLCRRSLWACLVACPLVLFWFFVIFTFFERASFQQYSDPSSSFGMLQLFSLICLALTASPLLISTAPARGRRAAIDVTVFSKPFSH